MLEASNPAVPRQETTIWNVSSFAGQQMEMWNIISRECSQNEYLAKIVVANFLANTKHRLVFYKNVIDNVFLYEGVKDIFAAWFARMQRTYWGFTRLAILWKRRIPKIQIYTDLYMNELDIGHLHTYSLMQRGNVYLFTLSNLVNLITTAITNSVHFRHAPLHVKNPYNNIEFSKSDLYNIYFRVLDTYIKVPFFLRRFFECDFNIYRFKMECEVELREKAIREYANTVDYREVFGDVEAMIRKYDTNRYIRISNGFDRKLVVKAFRPFLATYYLSLFSFDATQQTYCKLQLEREIPQFTYTNYLFGQRTGDNVRSSESPFVYTPYEEYHTKWEMPKRPRLAVEHFMRSHIFKDIVFDRYAEQGDVNSAYSLPICYSADFYMDNPQESETPERVEEQHPLAQAIVDDDDDDDDNDDNESVVPFPESDDEEEDGVAATAATEAAVIEEERLSEVSEYEDEEEEEEEEDYDW